MLAIDTNVLVRYLAGDDVDQTRTARALVDQNEIWVATTVLLEAEWVLRSGYGRERAAVVQAFTAFAGLPQVRLQDPQRIALALAWTELGMDFADALHLAAAEGCEAFVTFDKRLAKIAPHQAPTVEAL